MTAWICLVVYLAGFLIACRLLARYAFDIEEDGLLIVGLVAVFWPLGAVVVVPMAVFTLPVWLVTRGVKRR